MPKYSYKARNMQGKIITGEMHAPNKPRAMNILASKRMRPIRVVVCTDDSKHSSSSRKGIQRFIYKDKQGRIQIQIGENLPNTKELALFSKQFSLMIENGIPMLQALQLLKDQQKNKQFADIIANISSSIEQGSNLSDALDQYSNVFDSLYVAMTRAGEASGKLDIILKQLVKYIEKSAKLKSQVKSAMTYPIIILLVSVIVITVLLVFVVPSFAKQFEESGNALPAVTQYVLDASNFIMGNWDMGILSLLGSFITFKYWHSTAKGRKIFDTYILKVPILGEVILKISIGRFCATMSTMLSSGVAILDALDICASSSGNKRIEEFVIQVKEEISKGQNFSDPLQDSPLFPKIVSSMVAVGESTGTLDETLAKVTEIYEDEVDNAIAAMMSMIEPVMIIVIGSIVGFILIAMYLPIFDMANNVGGG